VTDDAALVVVHPYEAYDDGVTEQYVADALDAFDGDTYAVLSREPMGRPHGGTDAYDDTMMDRTGHGRLPDDAAHRFAGYRTAVVGGGHAGVGRYDGCLRRCFHDVQPKVEETGLAVDLSFNPHVRVRGGPDTLDQRDGRYRLTALADGGDHPAAACHGFGEEELADAVLSWYVDAGADLQHVTDDRVLDAADFDLDT